MKKLIASLILVVLGVFAYAHFAGAGQTAENKPSAGTAPGAKPETLAKVETATFAGGCFWGIQDKFEKVKGVVKTTVGYTGGTLKNPTYEEVCRHDTGHAEAVEVQFDPSVVTYQQLVEAFWKLHNPSEKNRQGPDVGENYRSAIFYHTPEQKAIAEASKQKMNTEGGYADSIVTEIVPASDFYPAEEYHQHYFKKNGQSCSFFR